MKTICIEQRQEFVGRYEMDRFKGVSSDELRAVLKKLVRELVALMRDTFLRWQISEEFANYVGESGGNL